MHSLIFNPDTQQVLDDHKTLLKTAKQEHLANQAVRSGPSLYERAVVAFGRTLVHMGQRLQQEHGLLRSTTLRTNEKGM